ncbi:MAG: aminodeoxychorismate synthase component I [Saprospiraceae bacterium]|nr:aminodeoxychorismate synthase component I [Saprospiraceae bacterium]
MENFRSRMNELGSKQRPFLFLIDYEMQAPHIWERADIDASEILFDINGISNFDPPIVPLPENIFFEKFPLDFDAYKRAFDKVQKAIQLGDTYLANLTFATQVLSSLSLRQIIEQAQAPYRFYWKNQFAFFSPESFIKIEDQKIKSFPMKGTIRADVPNAEITLLENAKERAEHATITDLIRNDLSRVAEGVRVKQYRYLEGIEHQSGKLLQTSTEIVGDLDKNYKDHLGDIIMKLLPAGSISGAPKGRTVEVLADAEAGPRGYYTGIVGYFDGQNLDSAVAIRFLEQEGENLWYRSGGGLTYFSDPVVEYEELLQKIYLPVTRKRTSMPTC